MRSCPARFERGHGRQGLAFEELEEGAAAGGDVVDAPAHAEARDRRQRVAATGDAEGGAGGDGRAE